MGTGGGSLAAGRQKPEVGCPVLSVETSQRKKRAIVAVARKLLCVLYAMLRTSTPYKIVTTQTTAPRTTGKESVRTSTPDRTTPTETTAPRTTRKEAGQDIDSGADHTHGDHGSSDNWQEVGQDIDSGPDHTHGDHGPSDNWQEVGQDVDSGPDHNHVAGRPVPEKEGRARPNGMKSL